MNDNVIIKFIDLISNWSVSGQIIGFVILLSAIAFFFFEKFRNVIIDIIVALFHINDGKPEKHPFFLQKTILRLQIDKIDFGDKDKTWLFQTLLKTKFDTTYEYIFAFIRKKDWQKMAKYELQAALMLLVKNIIESYEIKIRTKYIEKYSDSGNELFDLIYNSNDGFKQYHKRNVDNIQQNIQKIFIVDSFNNKEILNSFILQIWVALDTAINDCFITFRNLNGNVTKLINQAKDVRA